MTHNIKIHRQYADAVVEGDKAFEVRKNDRGYRVGDLVRFSAVDGDTLGPVEGHDINYRHYRITYVYDGAGLVGGYVVFGIEEV